MKRSTPDYVVLGMLGLGAQTGYDVKRAVDVSTRFFWAISHAQVYPALKRLERAKLVRGRADPRGRRRRRAYELTAVGRDALREWLEDDEPLTLELRDLGMLKLFFADAAGAGTAARLLEEMRLRSERQLARLRREIEPVATSSRHVFPPLTLRIGIAFHEGMIELGRSLEAELEREAKPPRGARRR